MEAVGTGRAGADRRGPDSADAGKVGLHKAGPGSVDADGAGTASRWRFLVSPRWLGWHAFAVLAFWGMCWLGDWQLHRALAGNSLSWAYTFEWPLFAIMGAVFWARTIRDEFRIRSGSGPDGTEAAEAGLPGAAAPAGASGASGGAGEPGSGEPGDRESTEREAADREAAAYLARLQEQVRGHGRWHGLR